MILTASQAVSYNLSGQFITVGDENPLAGVNIFLEHQADTSIKKYSFSRYNGQFTFRDLTEGKYILRATYMGYKPIIIEIVLNENKDLGVLKMEEDMLILGEFTITAEREPIIFKGDTTEFLASFYLLNPDASASDLVRRMPGMVVDGNYVEAQGEEVREVLVDGESFFGEEAAEALRNLPAEIIESIQIYERPSERARLSGVDDGEAEQVLNIVTKEGRNRGRFGKAFAGYGTEESYVAGGNYNFFDGSKRLSLSALSNNINAQSFDTEMQESGGGRAGGRRTLSAGPAHNRQTGRTGLNSFGLNYNGRWSEQIKVHANYHFNHSHHQNISELKREYYTGDERIYLENRESENTNMNHNLNFRLEYDIDDANTIVFTPRIAFRDAEAETQNSGLNIEEGTEVSSINNNLSRDNRNFNLSNDLLYSHRFNRERRSLSIQLRQSLANSTASSLRQSENHISGSDSLRSEILTSESKATTENYRSGITYTEPLGSLSMLAVNYNFSYQSGYSERESHNISEEGESSLDSLLSNRYRQQSITHNTGLSYTLNDSLYRFNAGIDYQHAELSGRESFPEISSDAYQFQNLLPHLRFNYRLSARSNLNLHYRSNTSNPSLTQLQDVIDNSNPQAIRSGNPALKPAYNHTLNIRYRFNDRESSSVFFATINSGLTNNYIGNAVITARTDSLIDDEVLLMRGAELYKPLNLDKQLSLRTNLTYSFLSEKLKSRFNINAGAGFRRTPGQLNNQISYSDNLSVNSGFVASSNISEMLDFTLSYNASLNQVHNQLNPQRSNRFLSQNSSFRLNYLFAEGFVFATDMHYTSYYTYGQALWQDYFLLNAALGYKFLKNNAAEVRFQVSDLFNNHDNFRREITETYVEESEANVLNRYYLLTFTYTFRHFAERRP